MDNPYQNPQGATYVAPQPAASPYQPPQPQAQPQPPAPQPYQDDLNDVYDVDQAEQPTKQVKQKQERSKTMLLRILISLVIIALGTFVILWAVAKYSLNTSIAEMLRRMFTELGLMWARITA